ncbi:MAG TPA: sulfite exporter TauE/SafE family protein [Nitrospirota bacterium]|nr:sulfite exporter TauE/SafE family protein [Nitrospirota bacterium]
MHITMGQADIWWPGLVLLGFFIGIITSMFGVGGGFLLTPALRILFNIAYPLAIGTSLLQITVTALYSAYKQWRQKNLDLKMGAVTAIGSLVGAEFGVRMLMAINMKGGVEVLGHTIQWIDLVINCCFLVLMTAIALFMYWETCSSGQCGLEEPRTAACEIVQSCPIPPFICFERCAIPQLSIWVPIVLSLFVGCLTGFLGIGGGFVILPLMIYIIGIPTRIAVGTSTLQVLLASAYGTLRYFAQGNVDLLLVLFMLIGSIIGVSVGARIAKMITVVNTRKYFSTLLAFAILLIVFDTIRRLW